MRKAFALFCFFRESLSLKRIFCLENRLHMENCNGKKEPLVDIVMPCYNASGFIGEAIKSVIGQTYQNWNLWVVDDASTDDTVSVVREAMEQDPRIHLLTNYRNQGAARTRNRGLKNCRGEYVALLDSDDCWYEEKLECQVSLAQRSGADIVYCSYGMVDENGERRWNDFIVPETVSFRQMLSSSVISCSTALLRKQVINRFYFPEDCYHEDFAYWMILLKNGYKAVGDPKVLADYRVRKNSRASNKWTSAKGRWDIYRKVLKLPLYQSVGAFARYTVKGIRKYSKK